MDENDPTDSPEDFQSLVTDVIPLQQDRVHLDRGRNRGQPGTDYRRLAATQRTERESDTLSDQEVEAVSPEESLFFCDLGVDAQTMKRLKRGRIPWEAELDLHGYRIEEAKTLLSRFIHRAVGEGMRAVLVVHGKAYRSNGRPPVIKSSVNTWLRQLPRVLAFCSAQPRDGGTGSVYVLLRRQRHER